MKSKVKITYRVNTQKVRNGFKDILNLSILKDICFRISGQHVYTVDENNDSYNKGRLIILEHNGFKHYISLSESRIEGRNSSLQSVPTALNIFYSDPHPNKKLWYYFIPYYGNPFTDYHLVYYRLMLTAGFEFLNINDYYDALILPYSMVDEIIEERSNNQNSNRGNNSSFISKTQDRVQLYAKTYGANKYESTVLGVALSKIADKPVEIFAVSEKDLKNLPQSSLTTFDQFSNITVYNTSLRLNRLATDTDETLRLRSAAYNFNLLNRIGMKKCALCGCEIPEIIHGAHIWGVAEIRNCHRIDDVQKYSHAVSGHNGLWLCHNHHKLFDSNFLVFDLEGNCLVKNTIPKSHESFIQESIISPRLEPRIITDDFRYYLSQRNQPLNMSSYCII